MSDITQKIFNTLDSVLNDNEQFKPLHIPIFDESEIDYVTDCIRSNFVSSVGAYVNKLELMLQDYTGIKHAILTVNGTAALHVSLVLVGVKQHDEVLMPAMTFIATANAVSYINATPHFVDVDEQTLGIDSDKLDAYLAGTTEIKQGECFNKVTGKRIKAIVPMHTFGHSVDMDKLNAVANKYHIVVVEDAAESLGSFYKGKHTGHFSQVAALSFNGNKIITTGGGGAILTNDDDLAKKARHITTTAKVPHSWEYVHDSVAYNYRMPALNAALGVGQMEKLASLVDKKRALAERYKAVFSSVEGVRFFVEPEYAVSNYWLNAIILDEKNEFFRNDILEFTNNHNIMTRPIWKLLNTLDMFAECPKMDLSISESLEKVWVTDTMGMPFVRGGRTFYYFNNGNLQQSLLMVQECESCKAEILLDPNSFSTDGTISLSSAKA